MRYDDHVEIVTFILFIISYYHQSAIIPPTDKFTKKFHFFGAYIRHVLVVFK